MAPIGVIICIIVIWSIICVVLNNDDKPKDDYPRTEAKTETFCETINKNKTNG